MPDEQRPPPPGFVSFEASPFSRRIGPLFVDRGGQRPVFGAFVGPHQRNTMGFAHGGFLSALVDIASGQVVRTTVTDGAAVRTVSSTVDFVSSAQVGDWVTADAEVERAGNRVVFVTCRISTGETLVARASVVFARAG